MANTPDSTRQPSRPRRSSLGRPWMGERQLDAYLQARETLRRLRAAAGPSADSLRQPSNSAIG